MVLVFIPSLMRKLTNGLSKLDLKGETIREIIILIDERYPGFYKRLVENDEIKPEISIIIDGTISEMKLNHRLDNVAEVHFVPFLAGG